MGGEGETSKRAREGGGGETMAWEGKEVESFFKAEHSRARDAIDRKNSIKRKVLFWCMDNVVFVWRRSTWCVSRSMA